MKRNLTIAWKMTDAEEEALKQGANLSVITACDAVGYHFGSAIRLYADGHDLSYRESEEIIARHFEERDEHGATSKMANYEGCYE